MSSTLNSFSTPLVGGLTAVLVCSLVPSCRPGAATRPGAGGAGPPATPVMVALPERRVLTEWKEVSGRLDAVESVEIRPRVTGHLERLAFTAGQLVKKGDVLFVIDSRWHRAALASAEAQLARARANLANAEREWERNRKLEKSNAISASEADQWQTRVEEGKAAVLAAEAARETAALDLESTEVRSPISGRVSRPMLTEGNYVSGVAGFTSLLTTVVSVDPIYVYSAVDETTYLDYARKLREKQISLNADGKIPVQLQLPGEEGWPHHGWVESFDNRIDPTTGSIVVRGVLPNPDLSLVAGAFCRVRVPISQEYDAILVDEKVIGTDQDQKYVLTLGPNNVAQYRPVTLGDAVDGQRIVRSGLTGEDQIIVSNLQLIRPGAPVNPLPPTPAAASKTAQR
ncbi:MAG: efflux RND transporter periplasmic adaptor subunit [Verrucomicrobiales bacterium]